MLVLSAGSITGFGGTQHHEAMSSALKTYSLSFVCTRFVARRGEEMRGKGVWKDEEIFQQI